MQIIVVNVGLGKYAVVFCLVWLGESFFLQEYS